MKLHNPSNLYCSRLKRSIAERVYVADSFWLRLRGLVGRPALHKGEALWIKPCQQVHMFFMRQPQDIVFIDRSFKIVHIASHLRPWRVSAWVRQAHSVLELPSGTAFSLKVGDELVWND